MKKNIENLIPYVIFGIIIASFVGLLFLFSHLIIWGVVIGGFLWLFVTIKNYFSPQKPDKKGRIIEHDDKK